MPNTIFAALPQMGAAEVLCTLVLVRETYGCDRPLARLFYSDFMRLTGIGSKNTVARALEAVERRGFFRRTGQRGEWEVVEQPHQRTPRSI